MHQSRVLDIIGALGLMAWTGWSQLASAARNGDNERTRTITGCGDCNTTDPGAFDATKFSSLDDAVYRSPQRADDARKSSAQLRLQFLADVHRAQCSDRQAARHYDGSARHAHRVGGWRKFIPLLDVMLPGGAKPDWKKRAVPPACRAQHDADPSLMVVKMIEESFNQPFRTGPLIDQNNNYAIFDILMNQGDV